MSPRDTPLWGAIQRAVGRPFPDMSLTPRAIVGFADTRSHHNRSAVDYGAGLSHPAISNTDFATGIRGHDVRVDVAGRELSTNSFIHTTRNMLG